MYAFGMLICAVSGVSECKYGCCFVYIKHYRGGNVEKNRFIDGRLV